MNTNELYEIFSKLADGCAKECFWQRLSGVAAEAAASGLAVPQKMTKEFGIVLEPSGTVCPEEMDSDPEGRCTDAYFLFHQKYGWKEHFCGGGTYRHCVSGACPPPEKWALWKAAYAAYGAWKDSERLDRIEAKKAEEATARAALLKVAAEKMRIYRKIKSVKKFYHGTRLYAAIQKAGIDVDRAKALHLI